SRGSGESKDAEPAGRSQSLVTLFPVSSAQRIYYQLDSFASGQVHEYGKPVGGPVVDRVVKTASLEKGMFRSAGRSIGDGSNVLGDFQGREPHSATGIMNQDGFMSPERAHCDQQSVGSQVIDRKRSS